MTGTVSAPGGMEGVPDGGRRASAAWRIMRASPGGRLIVIVVASLVGFLLVGQLRTSQQVSRTLAKENEGDLARILSDLNLDAGNLRDQIGQLKLELFSLQTSTQRDQTASRTAAQQLQALQVLAGTVAASGPGVEVSISDPQVLLRYDLLIDLVQELRDAGAEAIAVNGQRIGATTAFGPDPAGVSISGPGLPPAPLAPPYRVDVIGQPDTLAGALAIPGGALDTLQAQRGVRVAVQRQDRIDVPALPAAPTFRFARPVGSGP
jgi:uncharacterized protein YlxW (UPF0749 family)